MSAALLMSYFTTEVEAMFLALSVDGYRFVRLNDGRPVLRGQVGERSLRDPFVGVGADGDYHLVATNGWTSTAIVHARSADLRTWGQQRLIPVMSDIAGAHNAWAPEFFLDPESGRYNLIWSSVVDRDAAADASWQHVGQDHRIWRTTTVDFVDVAPATPFFDPGHSVIDASVVRTGERWVMAFKDERDTAAAPSGKRIMLTTFTDVAGPFTEPSGPLSPPDCEGPSMFRRGDGWAMVFDHYLDARYGCLSSPDARSWAPSIVEVPAEARHASVVPLTTIPAWIAREVEHQSERIEWAGLPLTSLHETDAS